MASPYRQEAGHARPLNTGDRDVPHPYTQEAGTYLALLRATCRQFQPARDLTIPSASICSRDSAHWAKQSKG
jgi:hypothetical protein